MGVNRDVNDVEQHVERLCTELAEIERWVITRRWVDTKKNAVYSDLVAAREGIGTLWTGPDAVEEIRQQREK